MAHFIVLGNFKQHSHASRSVFRSVSGPDGPTHQEIRQPSVKIRRYPTKVSDKAVAQDIRDSKAFNRVVFECDAKGNLVGDSADSPAAVAPKPEPEAADESGDGPATVLVVSSSQDAVEQLARLTEVDVESLKTKGGNLSAAKIRKFAESNGYEIEGL